MSAMERRKIRDKYRDLIVLTEENDGSAQLDDPDKVRSLQASGPADLASHDGHADSFTYRWLAFIRLFPKAQRDPSHGEQAPRSRDEAPGARRGHGAPADARGVEPGEREEEPTDREAPEHRERPRDLPQVRVPSGLDPRTVLENSGELERYGLKASTDSLGLSFFFFYSFPIFLLSSRRELTDLNHTHTHTCTDLPLQRSAWRTSAGEVLAPLRAST